MIGEVILADWAKVSAERKVVCLRYLIQLVLTVQGVLVRN